MTDYIEVGQQWTNADTVDKVCPTTGVTLKAGCTYTWDSDSWEIDAASQAKLDAASVLADITAISDDGKIDKSERPKVFADWQKVYTSYNIHQPDAAGRGISTTAYTTAFNALSTYLVGLGIPNPPTDSAGATWIQNASTIAINRTTFRSKFNDYFQQEDLLMTQVTAAVDSKATNAATDASNALTYAGDALGATTAIEGKINDIQSDNKIAADEKSYVFARWKDIYAEKPKWEAQANSFIADGYDVSSEKTSYVNAYNALKTYLITSPISIQNPPTDGILWVSDQNSISITGSDFRAKFNTYYDTRDTLINKLLDTAKAIAKAAEQTAVGAANAAGTAIVDASTALSYGYRPYNNVSSITLNADGTRSPEYINVALYDFESQNGLVDWEINATNSLASPYRANPAYSMNTPSSSEDHSVLDGKNRPTLRIYLNCMPTLNFGSSDFSVKLKARNSAGVTLAEYELPVVQDRRQYFHPGDKDENTFYVKCNSKGEPIEPLPTVYPKVVYELGKESEGNKIGTSVIAASVDNNLVLNRAGIVGTVQSGQAEYNASGVWMEKFIVASMQPDSFYANINISNTEFTVYFMINNWGSSSFPVTIKKVRVTNSSTELSDSSKIQNANIAVGVTSTPPANPTKGQNYTDPTTNIHYVCYADGTWTAVANQTKFASGTLYPLSSTDRASIPEDVNEYYNTGSSPNVAGLYKKDNGTWRKVSTATAKKFKSNNSPHLIESLSIGDVWLNTSSTQTVLGVIIPAGSLSVWDGSAWDVITGLVLSGLSDPISTQGKVGDEYINTTTNVHFRKSDSTTWVALANMLTNSSQLTDGAEIATAKTNATSAITSISNMSSDNILSPLEKQALKREWDAISLEKPLIEAQANAYSITTEKTSYTNAYQAFADYLNAGVAFSSGTPSWLSNLTTDTAITGSTLRTKSSDYYNAKVALFKKITDVAKTNTDTAATTANWGNVVSRPTSLSGLDSTAGGKLDTIGYYANATYISNGQIYGVNNGSGIVVDNSLISRGTSASDPASPLKGQYYQNTTDGKLYVCHQDGIWTATTKIDTAAKFDIAPNSASFSVNLTTHARPGTAVVALYGIADIPYSNGNMGWKNLVAYLNGTAICNAWAQTVGGVNYTTEYLNISDSGIATVPPNSTYTLTVTNTSSYYAKLIITNFSA